MGGECVGMQSSVGSQSAPVVRKCEHVPISLTKGHRASKDLSDHEISGLVTALRLPNQMKVTSSWKDLQEQHFHCYRERSPQTLRLPQRPPRRQTTKKSTLRRPSNNVQPQRRPPLHRAMMMIWINHPTQHESWASWRVKAEEIFDFRAVGVDLRPHLEVAL